MQFIFKIFFFSHIESKVWSLFFPNRKNSKVLTFRNSDLLYQFLKLTAKIHHASFGINDHPIRVSAVTGTHGKDH